MHKDINVICIYRGPGAGKSTTAAGVFHKMKLAGYNVELVTEYAKDLTWDERWGTLSNQLYVFAKQYSRYTRLHGKVDWIVTDSPLLLTLIYCAPDFFPDTLLRLVEDVVGQYTNHNFVLQRERVYNPIGRNQTEEEAREIDQQIRNLLLDYLQTYSIIPGNEHAPDEIMRYIEGS